LFKSVKKFVLIRALANMCRVQQKHYKVSTLEVTKP
jgi:hypothetical protein